MLQRKLKKLYEFTVIPRFTLQLVLNKDDVNRISHATKLYPFNKEIKKVI